jgi:Kef-type K+ transport system membrane component KefB
MAVLTPAFAVFVFGPLFRWSPMETCFARGGHRSNIVLMILVLGAFLSIAAYAGASVLFGAFLSGTFLSSLPAEPGSRAPAAVADSAESVKSTSEEARPSFIDTFEKYLSGVQRFILQPLFFASVGFAIPFLELWTGEVIWKGIVFTILMACAKLVVGLCIPVCDVLTVAVSAKAASTSEKSLGHLLTSAWAPASLLGTAMVARGEIGLLIAQVALNETPFLARKAFVIAVWGIVLNTIIGPVSAGFLIKKVGPKIAGHHRWGTQLRERSGRHVPEQHDLSGEHSQGRGLPQPPEYSPAQNSRGNLNQEGLILP